MARHCQPRPAIASHGPPLARNSGPKFWAEILGRNFGHFVRQSEILARRSTWQVDLRVDSQADLWYPTGIPPNKVAPVSQGMVNQMTKSKLMIRGMVEFFENALLFKNMAGVVAREFTKDENQYPKEVKTVVHASQCFVRACELGNKIEMGKSAGGILETTVFLEEFAASRVNEPTLYGGWPGVGRASAQIEVEWQQELDSLISKVTAAGQFAGQFIENYEAIEAAVKEWKFDAIPLATETALREDVAKDFTKLANFVAQFPNWKSICERANKHMGWTASDNQQALQDTVHSLVEIESNLFKASSHAAELMLTNAVLNPTAVSLSTTIKYCSGTFKVDAGKVQETLRDKIEQMSDGLQPGQQQAVSSVANQAVSSVTTLKKVKKVVTKS